MKRNTLLSAAVVALVLLAMTITPLLAQNGNVWNVAYFANPNWSAPPTMGMRARTSTSTGARCRRAPACRRRTGRRP